jgi:hypothetical protein
MVLPGLMSSWTSSMTLAINASPLPCSELVSASRTGIANVPQSRMTNVKRSASAMTLKEIDPCSSGAPCLIALVTASLTAKTSSKQLSASKPNAAATSPTYLRATSSADRKAGRRSSLAAKHAVSRSIQAATSTSHSERRECLLARAIQRNHALEAGDRKYLQHILMRANHRQRSAVGFVQF